MTLCFLSTEKVEQTLAICLNVLDGNFIAILGSRFRTIFLNEPFDRTFNDDICIEVSNLNFDRKGQTRSHIVQT